MHAPVIVVRRAVAGPLRLASRVLRRFALRDFVMIFTSISARRRALRGYARTCHEPFVSRFHAAVGPHELRRSCRSLAFGLSLRRWPLE
ncbi:MAG TPA: hypothetical protein VIK91_01705, partial [Nannocystis sp.]